METVRSEPRESVYFSGMNPVTVSLVTMLWVTLIALVRALRRRKRLPPGPFAWPVLGNLPAMSEGLPHQVLRSLATKYGGLMYLQLGSVPTIVVSTVDVSKEIFQTCDAMFLNRPKIQAFDALTDSGKNFVFVNGRYWRDVRKFLKTELFSTKRLATYEAARAEEIHYMMNRLVEDAKQGRAIDLKNWLLGITFNNMTRMLTSKRYFGDQAHGNKEKGDFQVLAQRTFELFGAFIVSDFVPWLAFVTKLQGWQKTMEEVRDLTHDFAGRVFEIEKHRQAAAEREKGDDDGDYVPDMVDVMLGTHVDDGKILPDKNIMLILNDLLNAGTDTVAGTVEFAMAELMRRPQVMERLQDELNTVIGPDRVPQESDIPKLPFLQAVVKETFRLHPSVPLNLPRESNQEFEFRGFKFAKHTRLILNISAIQRDPSVYESPDEFKPERFWEHPEINHLAAFESFKLTPFSAGRRMCPGAQLGNTMVSLILAHLAHSIDWALPEGVETVDITDHFGMTLSLETPLRLLPNAKPPAFLYSG